jgi:hypothetical protein
MVMKLLLVAVVIGVLIMVSNRVSKDADEQQRPGGGAS